MITERDDQQEHDDDRATLAWSLLVSGFANLMLWMVLAWVIALRTHGMVVPNQPTEVFTVTSSSLNIAKRTQPVPAHPNQAVVAQQQQQQPQQPKTVVHRAQPQPQAQPTEIAHIVPSAPPQPRSARRRGRAGNAGGEARSAAGRVSTRSAATQPAEFAALGRDDRSELDAGRAAAVSDGYLGSPRRASAWRRNHLPKWDVEMARLRLLQRRNVFIPVSGRTPRGRRRALAVLLPPRQDPFLRGSRWMAMPFPGGEIGMPSYRLPSGIQLQPQAKQVYDYWLSQQ